MPVLCSQPHPHRPCGARRMATCGLLLACLAPASALATYAQSLHGGCYRVHPTQCRVHVHPFVVPVNTSAGERFAQLQLYLNRVGGSSELLWDFSSASSFFYKPSGNFSPALPARDFNAECGATYYLNILTRGDTSGTTGNFGNAGVTAEFSCPPALALPAALFANGFEGN
jgi:hypothetical protein